MRGSTAQELLSDVDSGTARTDRASWMNTGVAVIHSCDHAATSLARPNQWQDQRSAARGISETRLSDVSTTETSEELRLLNRYSNSKNGWGTWRTGCARRRGRAPRRTSSVDCKGVAYSWFGDRDGHCCTIFKTRTVTEVSDFLANITANTLAAWHRRTVTQVCARWPIGVSPGRLLAEYWSRNQFSLTRIGTCYGD